MKKLLCKWFNLITKEDHHKKMTEVTTAFRADIYTIIDGGFKGEVTRLSYETSRKLEKMIWQGDTSL